MGSFNEGIITGQVIISEVFGYSFHILFFLEFHLQEPWTFVKISNFSILYESQVTQVAVSFMMQHESYFLSSVLQPTNVISSKPWFPY